ncbi:HEAT repeat domain-containing protein [Phragmitibacter flavus]|uniref:HEAT repeat domain-containing protein n=1 Tax=Phragmitibacter flavus TaxID=2576071 RepID=A0A5R8KDL2_9BACT|nr:HEAT repeat domain-containing protein [Phragmitibacter flavus]TLD70392.1 HEAT repeat domain-containing protein [Phragmitibacter flavus]
MEKAYNVDLLPEKLAQLTNLIREGESSAAEELGSSGSSNAVDALTLALTSKSWNLRDKALTGIRAAIKKHRATPKFMEALADPIAAILKHPFTIKKRDQPQDAQFACQKAIQILPQIDGEKAISLLNDPKILRLTNPDLTEVLKALNVLPGAVRIDINDWLKTIRPAAVSDTYPYPNIYSELLCSLAHHNHPSLQEHTRDVEKNFPYYSDAQVGAAEAKCIVRGLPHDFVSRIIEIHYELPWDRLSKPVQNLAVAIELDAYTYSGIEQYILQGGHRVEFAIETLQIMGKHTLLWKLQQCIELFGPAGIPIDFKERADRMDENDGFIFSSIMDMQYQENLKSRDLKVLYYNFAAQHAEEILLCLKEATSAVK